MTTFSELRKDGMEGTIVLYSQSFTKIDTLVCDFFRSDYRDVGCGECHNCPSTRCPVRIKVGVTV